MVIEALDNKDINCGSGNRSRWTGLNKIHKFHHLFKNRGWKEKENIKYESLLDIRLINWKTITVYWNKEVKMGEALAWGD